MVPNFLPRKHKIKHDNIDAKMFNKPNKILPFSNIKIVSSEKVENEVKPPNIPTAKKL